MIIGCFLVIGPCEEIAKFLAVRLFVYRNHEFDEPLDGIIYAAAAALGFASLENVLYVIDWHTGVTSSGARSAMRSLLALPGHVIFADDVGLRARAAASSTRATASGRWWRWRRCCTGSTTSCSCTGRRGRSSCSTCR